MITPAEIDGMIADGVATGGMQAKLNAAAAALEANVAQVRIAPGADAGVLERLLAGEEIGTRIAAAEVHSV
jgi:acetylglutamate kinase